MFPVGSVRMVITVSTKQITHVELVSFCRYDLRLSALEFFMADRSNCLFNFGVSYSLTIGYENIQQDTKVLSF